MRALFIARPSKIGIPKFGLKINHLATPIGGVAFLAEFFLSSSAGNDETRCSRGTMEAIFSHTCM
jgi:hypothetical protein